MPFWSDSSKAENYKAKLEHKMCIAKETPEKSFDLADCNLTEIPSGVFSMCRVFLKESLLLQDNHLTNLHNGGSLKDLSQLLVLNLKNNKLNSLPDDIGHLIHLQELNLENNRLRKLPSTFEKLVNLRHLILKGNRLLSFPPVLCTLHNLQTLNLCNNPKIKTLPKESCHLTRLKGLEIDGEHFTYPPSDVCLGGTQCIMKFLCEEMGKEYIPVDNLISTSQSDDLKDSRSDEESLHTPDLAASYLQYQRAKEQRLQDLLLMEDALKESYIVQSSSAADATVRRQKLMEDIAQEQERMEAEIMLLQDKKEKEKQNLLDILSNVENHSAMLIEKLMTLNDRTKNVDRMLAVLERDRIESEEIFTIKQEELEQLRKKEILEAMTDMLQCEEKQRRYEVERNNATAKLQNNENENNMKLFNIFQERELDQQILVNKLLEEEQFQKEAFEALQLQKDIQHLEIARQIQLIEKELSSLTAAEIKKKDLKITSEVNVLAEHRTALAYLLTELLSAKEQREKELKERLQQMELKRAHEMEDFWLIQYQKLLNRKPKGVMDAELGMDSTVKKILIDASAVNFLPLFAAKKITLMQLLNSTVTDLKKIGILDEDLCLEILDKAKELCKVIGNTKQIDKEAILEIPGTSFAPLPSAPPEVPTIYPEQISPSEIQLPSAPPLSPDSELRLWCQTECVICMDIQSTAVFLPCGHVCCCQGCSNSVTTCPMCRTVIASKFVLTI